MNVTIPYSGAGGPGGSGTTGLPFLQLVKRTSAMTGKKTLMILRMAPPQCLFVKVL
jgi:hypothetical protein